MRSGRPARIASLVLVAVLGVAACSNPPSAKRVALEMVDTLEVTDDVKQCMRDEIETYSTDELQAIADAADGGNADALDQFEADLAACNDA